MSRDVEQELEVVFLRGSMHILARRIERAVAIEIASAEGVG